MSAPCIRTLVRLVLGYAICAVVPVTSQNSDPLRDYQLVFVQAVWRHGNRTQSMPYPVSVEEATELSAPYGIGNLAPSGRREAFNMGLFLRERYGDFLPPYFTYTSTYIECTQFSRTQETCLTGMAGLYSTTGPQIWQDEGLGAVWTPIPCHYEPLLQDKVFNQFYNCPRQIELQMGLFNTPLFRAEVARLTDLGLVNEYVAINDGRISVSDFGLVSYYDFFYALEGVGKPLPQWAYLVYPEPLRSIYGLYTSGFSATPEIARLMTGEFWNSTMQLADSLQKGTLTPSDRVFYGYSVHDLNVAALISSLKPRNIARPVPPYSAVFMIEWYRYNWDPTRIALKFLYRNDTQRNTVTTLDLPGCGEVCSLEDFREAVRDLIPHQSRSEYCRGQTVLAPAELEHYRQILSIWTMDNVKNQSQQ